MQDKKIKTKDMVIAIFLNEFRRPFLHLPLTKSVGSAALRGIYDLHIGELEYPQPFMGGDAYNIFFHIY